MTTLLASLPKTQSPIHDDEIVYRYADIVEKSSTVFALPANGLLAVSADFLERPGGKDDGERISFVVFDFHASDVNGSDAEYQVVFHGEGFGGPLRELRHTYWGEADNSGYIFYPNGKLISAAFKILSRWFDDLTEDGAA